MIGPVTVEANLNQPPVVDARGPYSGDEGSPIELSDAMVSDPDGDPLIYSWTVSAPTLCSFDDANALNPSLTCSDDGSFTATLTVSDGVNDPVSSDATVTVENVAPAIDSITAPTEPVNINAQPVSVEVAFSDPGTNDTHDVTWDWGDTTNDTLYDATSPASWDHAYTEAGVYTVQLTVTDDDGGSDIEAYDYIVIYDPEGGFVTGGGWITSPEGAYPVDPSMTGKANFGFVSKYKKGATVPTGNTEFNFSAGGLNFHSDTYEWLVVNQNGTNAQFKGSGTINGEGDYRFMLWAGDGDPDTFRITIWEEDEDGAENAIYDNGFDQAISGGSIVIHTSKK